MGCLVPIGVEIINAGSSPNIDNIVVTDETSQGANDGCITSIMASGGTAPYTYEIDNSPVISLPHCGLAPGVHQVCVIDANGCESCTDVTIGQGCGLQVTEAWIGTCVGTCDGEASVIVTGNIGPVSVVWMDSTGTIVDYGEYISNLCAGLYTFDVIDSAGCYYFGTVYIDDWALPQVSTTVVVEGTT
jgi:hypothetical protein